MSGCFDNASELPVLMEANLYKDCSNILCCFLVKVSILDLFNIEKVYIISG